MGQKLHGVDTSGLVNKHLAPGLVPLTVAVTTPGTRTAANPTAGTNPSTATSSGMGFREEYSDRQVDGTRVKAGYWKIIVIGDSLTPRIVPAPGDVITLEGKAAAIIVKDGVKSDPAEATYTCSVQAY